MRYKLKFLRIEKGYTHKEIASKIGISRAAYTNIEQGNKNLSYKLAIEIKKLFSYEKDDIFFDS